MDLTADQLRLLTKFLDDWSKDKRLELETTFGSGGTVDSTTFLHIAQRLRDRGFEVLPQDDRLSVITPSFIRLSLQGLGVIQSYCKDNSLQGKPFSAMFKDRAFPESNLDLNEYNMRFKVRREEDLSADDPRIVALLNNWETQRKAFRLIRRWTFRGKGIRIDMSMVRQTQRAPGKNEFDWATTFLQRNIFKDIPRYEVEVELLHDTEYTSTPKDALRALISGVGEVQRAIQKNTLLIRNSVANAVRAEYKAMLKTDKFRGVSPITLGVKNMTMESAELATETATATDSKAIANIRQGYNVTDKADGLRAMGFVNKEGELYMIDMSMNIIRTGLKNPKCAESLVDGEWVTASKEGRPINHYLVFDIYNYDKGKDVSSLPFITYKDGLLDVEAQSRYNKLQEWYGKWFSGVEVIAKGLTETTKLIVSLKRFEFATANNDTIFKACDKLLDGSRIYNTDGLILTSNTEPLPDKAGGRFNYQFKWKPAKDSTIDFLINFEKDPALLTLDKVTTTIHPGSETTIQYKTMRLFVGSDKDPAYDNPRSTILLQQPIPKKKGDGGKYKPVLFNPMDFPDTMANSCNIAIETDPETGEDYVITEDTNEPIQDRSIVEMRFDMSREPGWRWVPVRIRHDKTERLQRAAQKPGPTNYSRTLNSEAVANDVWSSIHNPITDYMIRTGAEEPSEEEAKTLIRLAESDVAKKYYERKAPKENIAIVRGLLDFHNKYIKNEILLKKVMAGGNKNVLDLACGKGGDLYKWLFNKARYVVGIDTAGDNITDPSNGAYARYLEAIVEFGFNRVPKMAFIIGNSSKDIVNGEAGATPEERDIMRSIFGKYEPEGPVPKYIESVMAGTFRAGADVASCMFALHYFFENKETLNGFMKNLSETVKIGGYFIGACFDGNRVFNLLKSVDKGRSKVGKEGDVPIWTLTKDYDNDVLTNEDDSIGLGVDVEFISIGAPHKEYLVPFDLLKKRLDEIGFDLLNDKELKEIGLKYSTNTFDVSFAMAEKAGKKYVMPESVKQFSFLNRWFIFKRRGETGMPLIKLEDMEEEVKDAKATIMRSEGVAESKGMEEGDEEVTDDEGEIVTAAAGPGRDITDTGAILPSPDRKFAIGEIFTIGINVPQKDVLKLGDNNMGRWIGLGGRFPVPDPDDPSITYPTVVHFMAGMKLKKGTTKPDLGRTLMSTTGKIHQDFMTKRRAEGGVKLESARDFDLLKEELSEVQRALNKTYLRAYGIANVDDTKWVPVKDEMLRYALNYRWTRDERFRKGVEAAKDEGKYMLYAATAEVSAKNSAAELSGVRSPATGKITGENKVGRFIMEIAGFRF
jgi:hypothetical protein